MNLLYSSWGTHSSGMTYWWQLVLADGVSLLTQPVRVELCCEDYDSVAAVRISVDANVILNGNSETHFMI